MIIMCGSLLFRNKSFDVRKWQINEFYNKGLCSKTSSHLYSNSTFSQFLLYNANKFKKDKIPITENIAKAWVRHIVT